MNEPAEPLHKPAAEWERILEPARFRVLFRDGTEAPWTSPLNAVKEPGTFICAACHLPLFETAAKFDSGTGWPSFFTTIPGAFSLSRDSTLGMVRTEHHCARCGGHHGHVFEDGPAPTGLRYCNNGVALRFIPLAKAAAPAKKTGPG